MRALAALGLLVVAAVACKGKSAPKVTPAQWAEVEAAAQGEVAPGPADELVRALTLIADDEFVDDLPGGFDPDDERLIDAVPEAALDAVEALVRWEQANGRLPARTCTPDKTLFGTLKLARVALLVGGADPDGAELRAVVRLGARYRAEGLSMLEGMVGGAIINEARGWADKLELPRTGALRGYAPTEDGLRRIVAAEAVCSLSLFAKLQEPDSADATTLREALGDAGRRGVPALIAAEGAHLRAYWITLLAELRGRAADPAATDRRIAERAERIDRQPERHPVLSLLVTATARSIANLRDYDDDHRAWLAGAPP
jgi:hypothetical protein